MRDGLEFVFSPDIIPGGWLGSKHQQTKYIIIIPMTKLLTMAAEKTGRRFLLTRHPCRPLIPPPPAPTPTSQSVEALTHLAFRDIIIIIIIIIITNNTK